MHERQKRFTPPDRHPYIAVDNVPGHDGTHHFRAPSPIVSDRVANLQQREDARMAMVGAMIGISWAHRDLEMAVGVPVVADLTDGELIAYGRDALEELHDSGYTYEVCILLSATIWDALRTSMTLGEEVQERLAFFARRKGDSTPSPSTVTSDSSADASAPSPD